MLVVPAEFSVDRYVRRIWQTKLTESFDSATGETEAMRSQVRMSSLKIATIYVFQVPLILAWALSVSPTEVSLYGYAELKYNQVHKSQGQTLERVRVDLSRTFESGQGASFKL